VKKLYFVLSRVFEILKTHKRGWIITLIGGGIFMISYFHRVNIAAFSNYLMIDIKISASSLGILASSYFYIYGFEQIISGTLSDVIKPKRLIVFSGILMAIGSFLFYFALSLNIAFLGRILIGVGAGFSFVPLLKIIATWFDKNKFSTVVGFITVLGNLGALLATVPFVILINLVGWRFSFLIIGVVTLVLSFLSLFFIECGPYTFDSMGIDLEGSIAEVSQNRSNYLVKPNFFKTLKSGIIVWISNSGFILLGLISFFTYGTLMSFQGLWISPLLLHIYKIPPEGIGGWLVIIVSGSILGRLLAGHITNRFLNRNKKLGIIVGSIMYGFIWFLIFYFINSIFLTILKILFFLLGISTSIIVINYLSLIRDFAPKENYGTIAGINNLFPFLGTTVFQIFIGYILENTSFFNIKITEASIKVYKDIFGIYFLTSLFIILLSLLLLNKNSFKKAR